MLFVAHLQAPFPRWTQTRGVLRHNLGGKGGGGGEDSVVLVQSQVTALGSRGSGWQVFTSAVLLQWVTAGATCDAHTRCMPVLLSNTLVAVLCQAPCPIFCRAWNCLNFATRGTSIWWSGLMRHLKCPQLRETATSGGRSVGPF